MIPSGAIKAQATVGSEVDPVEETGHARGDISSQSRSWSRLRPLLRGQLSPLVVLVVGSILAGLAESGILALLAQAAAALVSGASRVRVDLGALHTRATVGFSLVVALVLSVTRLALQAPISIAPARIVADVQARLRLELFSAFAAASWSEQSRDVEGHLQELTTDQVSSATGGALQFTVLLTTLIMFLMLVVSALALNVVAALAVLVAAVGLFALLRPLSTLGHRHGSDASRAAMDYASGVGEAVRLAQETQVFGVTGAHRERLDVLAMTSRRPMFQTQMLSRLVPGIYQSLIYLFVAGALLLLYAAGAGHLVYLGAVVLLLVRAGSYGQQAQGAYQALRQTWPYLERVQEAERRYRATTPRIGETPLETIKTLVFERVGYCYGRGRPVLRDISFEVSSGHAIGIVGPTGAGKSTLVQILLRLRPPELGRYLVNGLPSAEFVEADWHRLVAYVPQEPRLLHATVADNIRFFRDLSDEAVERGARLAGVHVDITNWPDRYNTIVGPRADAVSGGQQQRICLARALAAQPEVLILDEPTSALDPQSEFLIQESLAALRHQVTLFVVAHRMSTLGICDRVMVIVDGRLEAFDTADRVRSDNAYYQAALTLAAGSPAN